MGQTYKCAKCGAQTTRVTDGGPVCTPCFLKGYGRLPGMPLPKPETPAHPPIKAIKPAAFKGK